MNPKKIEHIQKVKGELNLSGDKSISHRAVIFSSIANGKSVIENCSDSEDVNSTIRCFMQMGVDINFDKNKIIINGNKKLNNPIVPLNSGNSATTARLLSGILIHQSFPSTIIGDESLSGRPMNRIVEPLKLMGGNIFASTDGTLPIAIFPSNNLHEIDYELTIPSAQVKSGILLSGLFLNNTTKVIEHIETRDHTERMLNLPIEVIDDKKIISANSNYYPQPKEYFIPSDLSTASFFVVLALLIPNSELIIKNVSLNPTRRGIINVLKEMGGNIFEENLSIINNELRGDLIVKSSLLHNIKIEKEIIPNIIDEIPILTVAAFFSEGNFEIRNARELRGKESDRINSIVKNLKQLNCEIDEFDDGFAIGKREILSTAKFNSFGDHRIAMAFSVFSAFLKNGGEIDNFGCINISNPKFYEQLKGIGS